MLPIEVIAVMRSKGWLKEEPQSVRKQITSAVRYLMVDSETSNDELSQDLPEASSAYVRRKISQNRWRMEDLDLLPEIFGLESVRHELQPSDFVRGYRWIAQLSQGEYEKNLPKGLSDNQNIRIMKERSWLRAEPRGTREHITSAVRYIAVRDRMSKQELASMLVNSRGENLSELYILRKVNEHRWRMNDLDLLPEIFGGGRLPYTPADFVQGYRRMAQLDNADLAADREEKEPHADE